MLLESDLNKFADVYNQDRSPFYHFKSEVIGTMKTLR